jgi:hypothetical protein
MSCSLPVCLSAMPGAHLAERGPPQQPVRSLSDVSHSCMYQFFDKCWMLACAKLWHSEYGCAVASAAAASRPCATPFARTLLQVSASHRAEGSGVAKRYVCGW